MAQASDNQTKRTVSAGAQAGTANGCAAGGNRTDRRNGVHRTGKFRNASKSEPCPICGKPDWCRISQDGSFVCCRRAPNGSADPRFQFVAEKCDSNGDTFYGWRIPSANGAPKPTCQQRPELADTETLDKVYRQLLRSLDCPLRFLRERKIVPEQSKVCMYRSLGKNRFEACRSLIEAGLESLLPGVPGFFVKTDSGSPRWTIAGAGGLLLPALDLDGRIQGVQVRLQEPVEGKYRWLSSKKHGGASPGAPIHFPPIKDRGETWRITEGVLKADIASFRSGLFTLGLPSVGTWRRAFRYLKKCGVKRVLVAFDADYRRNLNVARHLYHFVCSLRKKGFQVGMEVWPEEDGKGIDDLLTAGKQPTVLEGGDLDAELATIRVELDAQTAEYGHAGDSRAGDVRAEDDDRPEIRITPEQKAVNDLAVEALANDEDIFQRGALLVRVVREACIVNGIDRPEGTPRIVGVAHPTLQEHLSAQAIFVDVKVDKEGNETRTRRPPPSWCVSALSARGYWPGIRPLMGVVDCPVLRRDGTILDQTGYDRQTGLIYEAVVDVPPIASHPAAADIKQAVNDLADIICDFPMPKDEHRATWIAFVLTVVARFGFVGPAPLFLIDANVRGSGKSLLADLASIINTGRDASRMSNPGDDDEARKRITAIAINGDQLILIDNIVGAFGCASLDAALTGTSWKDRLLGRNETVEFPLMTVWSASGNNVVLAADTARRIAPIRIQSPLENPEERTGFRFPNVRAYALANRGKLLAAALTILRGYCAAGRPDQGLKPWGSFEGWSDLVRSAVVWAGLADPGAAREELRKQSDREANALRAIIQNLPMLNPTDAWLTVSEIVEKVNGAGWRSCEPATCLRDAIIELCPAGKDGFPSARSIGMKLHHLKGRIVGGKFLDRTDARGGVSAWRVESADGGTRGTGGTTSNPSRERFDHLEPKSAENDIEAAGSSPTSPTSPTKETSVCSACLSPAVITCMFCGKTQCEEHREWHHCGGAVA